jgi:hypothetical protein
MAHCFLHSYLAMAKNTLNSILDMHRRLPAHRSAQGYDRPEIDDADPDYKNSGSGQSLV